MSQNYLKLGNLPAVSYRFSDLSNIFFTSFKNILNSDLRLAAFTRRFFVWSSTKGFGLLVRRAHTPAACMYRQARGMTGAPVG